MEWVTPAARLEMESVARPLLRVPVPSEVDPSLNVTVPVAVEGETVAVKVTVWPRVDGLRLEVSVVVVLVLVVPPAAAVTAFNAFSLP